MLKAEQRRWCGVSCTMPSPCYLPAVRCFEPCCTCTCLAASYCVIVLVQDLEVPDKLRQKADVLLGAAYVKARQPPPDTWLVKPALHFKAGGGGASGGGKGKKRRSSQAGGRAEESTPVGSMEAAAAAAAASDAAVDSVAEQQGNQQDDQQQHQQQQQQHDGPSAADITPATAKRNAAQADPACLDSAGTAKRSRLSVQQPEPSLQLHGSTPASGPDSLAAATVAAAAAAAAGEEADGNAQCDGNASAAGTNDAAAAAAGSGNDSRSTTKFSVQPGEVVWVQTKSNPPWPALVITSEEATDFSVEVKNPRYAQVRLMFAAAAEDACCLSKPCDIAHSTPYRGVCEQTGLVAAASTACMQLTAQHRCLRKAPAPAQQPTAPVCFKLLSAAQVCLQYFGDYSRARVSASSLLPCTVALQQRLWLPTVLNRKKGFARTVNSYIIGLREFITYCKVRVDWVHSTLPCLVVRYETHQMPQICPGIYTCQDRMLLACAT